MLGGGANALDGTVNLGTNALLPFEHIDALADALLIPGMTREMNEALTTA